MCYCIQTQSARIAVYRHSVRILQHADTQSALLMLDKQSEVRVLNRVTKAPYKRYREWLFAMYLAAVSATMSMGYLRL